MKISIVFSSLLVAAALAGCATTVDDTTAADDAALTAAMVGDFHLNPRSLDEHFLFDGAAAELKIVKNGDDCQFQALQATGGCGGGDWHCSINELLSNRHSRKIEGVCTVAAGVLSLQAPGGAIALRVKSATVDGKRGYVLTSVSGDKLNRGGPSAFFVETSRDPDEAFKRSYAGGGFEALTKHFEPNDPGLSGPVRAAVASLAAELSEPIEQMEITREVDDTYVVFATPFDDTPIAYAVFSSHSGDHCGGYQVMAVNASGARLRTELSDGDCGL